MRFPNTDVSLVRRLPVIGVDSFAAQAHATNQRHEEVNE